MGQNTGCSFALKLPVASSFGSDRGKQTETEARLSTLKVTCAAAVMHCRGHRGQDRFTVLCCVKELEREKRVINRQRERGEVSRDSVRQYVTSFRSELFCQHVTFLSAVQVYLNMIYLDAWYNYFGGEKSPGISELKAIFCSSLYLHLVGNFCHYLSR